VRTWEHFHEVAVIDSLFSSYSKQIQGIPTEFPQIENADVKILLVIELLIISYVESLFV